MASLCRNNARGRALRLEHVLDEILTAHEYPAPITHLLAEALVLTALIGSLLKDDGSQVTMQAQTEAGPVRLLVCDYRGGELRGYAQFDEQALASLGANPSLARLFGEGYLALTFDLAGIVGAIRASSRSKGQALRKRARPISSSRNKCRP